LTRSAGDFREAALFSRRPWMPEVLEQFGA